METANPDFIFVARYMAPKDDIPTTKGEESVSRWCSIYGTQHDAYRGAAVFIRDSLLNSSLRTLEKMETIEAIEDAVRTGDVEAVISYWNEEFTKHQVKVYKGVAL